MAGGTPNVDVRTAVQAATQFLSEINPTRPPEEVAVEEVEFLDNEWKWLITLGYYPAGYSLAAFAGRKFERQYRVFTIDPNSGQVLSMKIRDR